MAVNLFYRKGRAIVIWGTKEGKEVTPLVVVTRSMLPSINAAKRQSRSLQAEGARFAWPSIKES